MIVILCHPDDVAALWLDRMFHTLGVTGIEIVSVEQLVFSRRIVHRLVTAGDSGEIALADGRTLHPETIAGLINRVQYLPTRHFASAAPADRAYAMAELSAFMLAWLNSVAGRVINPPLPFALGGGTFPLPTVRHLASMAGLPALTWRSSTSPSGNDGNDRNHVTAVDTPTHAVVVFDGRVFGPILPRPIQDGCRRLASLLGVPMLQVLFHQSHDNGWRFVHAHGAVDFRIGGRPLAAAIAQAFAANVAA